MLNIEQCKLEFSESGKIVRILTSNNRIVAELLVHGPLMKCAQNAEKNAPILNGRANIFRGELYGLPGYEFLNIEEERIEEKAI